MVEHNLSVVSTLSDHITVLARGEVLAQGDYASVSTNPGRHRGVPGRRPCLSAPPQRRRTPRGAPLLAVRDLQAWYGESHILHGVAFDVAPGEVVTLLGRNGAGKTTTLKSIMGVVPRREGSIAVRESARRCTCRRTASRDCGIAWCPEERGIFASLNVEENLLLPPKVRDGGLTVEQIYELFPEPRASGARARARNCPAASSRCWRSAASCAPARACCCSTSRPRAWRR